MAVADSVQAAFGRGAMNLEGLLPWFPKFVASPLRQLAVAPMTPLRFMIRDAAPPQLRGRVTAYAGRLYRKRYKQLGWRARPGDSSDTKLLREAVIHFMVMDVRDREARARAARLGKVYAGYRTQAKQAVVDPQLVGLVLSTAVREGDEGFFEHLLGLLDSSVDATARGRILSALGHAEDPILSARALDLTLDPRLRINEIGRLLGPQFHNPRTRDLAWAWFTEHFDELTARNGAARAEGCPGMQLHSAATKPPRRCSTSSNPGWRS